jgi:hypothetical protein
LTKPSYSLTFNKPDNILPLKGFGEKHVRYNVTILATVTRLSQIRDYH